MFRYRYVRYKDRVTLFQTEASNILEADAKFRAATGEDPIRATYIGCIRHDWEAV